MAHHISIEGAWPSKENLKAVAKFAPPQTYTEIQAFLGLVGHYWQFIKAFVSITQPVHEHLSLKGASRKNKQVTLTEDALDAFEMLKKACIEALVLAFADFNNPLSLRNQCK